MSTLTDDAEPSRPPRVAIAGLQHETNTFSSLPTEYRHFVEADSWPALSLGAAIVRELAELNLPIGGFIAEAAAFELLPIAWSSAEPGGAVSDDTFEQLVGQLVGGVHDAGRLDGIYLDLHGAMVTESHADGEAELLRRLREVVGPDLPIAVSLDLHGNLSRAFFDRTSITTIYRTYPHIDMADTGRRACRLLQLAISRDRPFAKAWRQLDYLIPSQSQATCREPGERLYGLLPSLEVDGVVSVDVAFGFPPADVPDCGCSVFAYGTDRKAVNDAADAMLAALAAAEPEFHDPLIPAEQAAITAVRRAETASRPVVIADAQDNPGAGATGDTTGMLEALIAAGARRTLVGMLWDPAAAAAAHAADLEGELSLSIGGRFAGEGYGPLPVRVRVEALADGRFAFTGPMYGGAMAALGPTAALRVLDPGADVVVVVGTVRAQSADLAVFEHLGIDPREQAIVCVKSAVHFLAAYEPIADSVLFAESPGANPCRLDRIAYTRLRDGVRLGPGGPTFSLPPPAPLPIYHRDPPTDSNE